MKIDFDAEARRGELTIETEEGLVGSVVVILTQDELIDLYRVLKAEFGEYVAEMDSYAAEFARSGTVGGWAPERSECDGLHRPSYDTLAEKADHDRKVAKGE